MKHLSLLLCCSFYGLSSISVGAINHERPNILWLTFEDTSAREFGCYGNKDVHTPNIDSLALRGIQFMNAWSVAPQSSAARSSLITGCYATTYGMDVHPIPYDTPVDIFFPQKLREVGYYCTNNNKTHYNSTTNNKNLLGIRVNKYAVIQIVVDGKSISHFLLCLILLFLTGAYSYLSYRGPRDYTREGIYPSLLSLPSYLPDLPEIRSDYAAHLESVQDVDTWLGFFLKDLKDRGLDKNTIIFFLVIMEGVFHVVKDICMKVV